MNAELSVKLGVLIGVLKAMKQLNSVSVVIESEFPTPETAIEMSLFVSGRVNAITIFEKVGKGRIEITIKRNLGEI